MPQAALQAAPPQEARAAAAEALLARLLPAVAAVAAVPPGAPGAAARFGEAAAVARAVPARQREFAAGRAAAYRAMTRLGPGPAPVPAGPDRAPRWPAGLVGSLTHGAGLCLAAVARQSDLGAIGIDAEEDAPLAADLVALVCTPAERAWLGTRPAAAAGRLGRLIFSAKESAYKAQYPLTGRLLDFDAFEVCPDPERGLFTARFTRAVGRFAAGARLCGHHGTAAGLLLTAVALPP